jgi:hypothetical protein
MNFVIVLMTSHTTEFKQSWTTQHTFCRCTDDVTGAIHKQMGEGLDHSPLQSVTHARTTAERWRRIDESARCRCGKGAGRLDSA